MFIYFKSIDSYLTCDEYPTFITTEIMKKYNLEYKCNKWIKTDNDDGTFLLSYKYKKQMCDCDNTMFDENLKSLYECFLCKKIKLNYKDGEMLYLQNSGCQDIVFVNNNVSLNARLIEIEGNPNMYAWANNNTKNIYALHVEITDDETIDSNMYLSDCNMKKYIEEQKNIDSCHIIFTNDIENVLYYEN